MEYQRQSLSENLNYAYQDITVLVINTYFDEIEVIS